MSYLDQLFSLKDKVAIVTGGNGQLGSQYVMALAQAGAKVAVFDLKDGLNEPLKKMSEELTITYFKVDITQADQLKMALLEVEKKLGAPEILINNAALDNPPATTSQDTASFEGYPLNLWEQVIKVNLTGVFLCCQVIGGRMAEKGKGSVINICSTYGLVSPDQRIYQDLPQKFVKPVSYSATKSALLNLTRYLATYWAAKGVRVNTLTPGGVFNNQNEKFVQAYSFRTPLGRMAKTDEYNGAIIFLASDASSYMTGANLIIDGGWTAW
jgi:NAD(P)-dependent dehydrogenase (short-subunit alcohol dehydrogenase family)